MEWGGCERFWEAISSLKRLQGSNLLTSAWQTPPVVKGGRHSAIGAGLDNTGKQGTGLHHRKPACCSPASLLSCANTSISRAVRSGAERSCPTCPPPTATVGGHHLRAQLLYQLQTVHDMAQQIHCRLQRQKGREEGTRQSCVNKCLEAYCAPCTQCVSLSSLQPGRPPHPTDQARIRTHTHLQVAQLARARRNLGIRLGNFGPHA